MSQSIRLTLLLTSLALSGCASTSAIIHDPGRLIGRPRPATSVGKIITLWEAADGSGIDGMPARGFAGQIMFFNTDESPIKVDGKVVIYQYDNYDDTLIDPQPIHSFTFDADAWNVHCSEGTLGHTYSVFLPYMQKHKQKAYCGLRVEFYCADGRKVSSDITSIMLPGKQSTSLMSATSAFRRTPIEQNRIGESKADSSDLIRRASSTSKEPPRKLESITIPLPRH